MKSDHQSLFQKDMVQSALIESFIKLNPKTMFRNPVMFLVEIGTVVMLNVSVWTLLGEKSQGSFGYNFIVFLVLFVTLLFANFAEAIAEARGKAQADSLRKTREETPAKKLIMENGQLKNSDSQNYQVSIVNSSLQAILSFVKLAILFLPMVKSSKV